ncbi:MAG: family 78 glycoside hydrolase catalytic domain [Bacteroidales bacterium]|nr:family 78 glycoside hydrolase catalytic domain [Bacteroidales bacterium]
MKRITLLLSLCILVLYGCGESVRITALQTEYQTNPLGIDVSEPRFSWQMESDEYGAAQTAYRVVVAEDMSLLEKGEYVFDTDKTVSDVSIGIVYDGAPLEAATRYFWKVMVWNEKCEMYESDPEWFETGLMEQGWSDAQWIGSSQPFFSKYRSHYNIDYDLQIENGSKSGVFVFGYQDDDNYVKAELNVAGDKPVFTISHITDGSRVEDFSANLPFIGKDKINETHHISLKVWALDYALGYRIKVTIDNTSLNKDWIVARPYPQGVWKTYCRFNQIGFAQPDGDNALFSNIKVTEDVWKTTLYTNNTEFREKGTGKINLFSPADESGAPMLRKSIDIAGSLKSARLYTTARGIYEYFINGQRVGNDYFNPGSTDYRYRIMYNTYDITDLLIDGDNVIGAQLGSGWWSDFTGFATAWQDQFGLNLSLLAKIILTYEKGEKEIIVSDGSWKVYDRGPILSNSMQNGEDYDARREVKDWSTNKYDDSQWTGVTIFDAPADSVEIQYYIGTPIQNNIILKAQSVTEPEEGVFVYDMGQNMVGVPRLHLKGAQGESITLKYGEMIYPEIIPEDPVPPLTKEIYEQRKGRVYNENYRGALSTDHYIFRGDDSGEIYQPHFTFHGYRYIEIHGLKEALPLDNVEGIVLESVGKQLSNYETSNDTINRLYSNIVWGQRGNFLSIPTDCPQRDERMGWTGDAQVFARSATYNMNVDQFYARWIESVRDIQGDDGSYFDYIPKIGTPPNGATKGGGAVGWMEAGVIIPWQIYQQYGDIRFIEQHYPSMVAYMKYLESRAIGNIQQGGGYGDWLSLVITNTPLTNTAYYAYDAMLMSKMAEVLGKKEDAKYFKNLYESVKETFNREFVNEKGITTTTDKVGKYDEWYASGELNPAMANTQTSYIVPLQADLFDDHNKPLVIKHLIENIKEHGNTLTTGFIGTPYINLVLSENGHDDLAYTLFEQTAYPSWLYPVLQGATTIWERWNSYTIKNGFGPVDMNSFNHYSYGAIQEWMMVHSLGIQRDESAPAYKHIVLQPKIGGTLSYINGYYDSMYGRIESGWKKIEGGYEYDFTVPANTTAVLSLETGDGDDVRFTKGGRWAQFIGGDQSTIIYNVVAGKYKVVVSGK